MTTTFRQSRAHYLGQHAGRAWRWLARVDRRAEAWVAAQGVLAGWAKAVLWGAKIVLLGAVVYAAFWLTLFALMAFVAIALVRKRTSHEEEELALVDLASHKTNLFYDPINYDDDPDPRFDDK